jgi:hypothetical protein
MQVQKPERQRSLKEQDKYKGKSMTYEKKSIGTREFWLMPLFGEIDERRPRCIVMIFDVNHTTSLVS